MFNEICSFFEERDGKKHTSSPIKICEGTRIIKPHAPGVLFN